VSMFEVALQLALDEHRRQTDKSGEIYILHPIHLASHFEDEDTRCAAVLHDSIEDGKSTPKYLALYGMNQKVIDMVVALTRKPGTSYWDYIKTIKHHAYPEVKQIKIKDLEHNMNILRIAKVREVTKQDLSLLHKYTKAWRILNS